MEEAPALRPSNRPSFFQWQVNLERTNLHCQGEGYSVVWPRSYRRLGLYFIAITSNSTVHHRSIFPDTGIWKLVHPASWLSALIFVNSILLHITVADGMAIAWWFKATRPETTVANLHET